MTCLEPSEQRAVAQTRLPSTGAAPPASTMVADGTPSPCPPEENLEAFYVAEACEISRREGRTVTIEEVRR